MSFIRHYTLFTLVFIAISAAGQRVQQYHPEGRDIVCINGNNRYTRALYGTHTAWRLETSDRPVFATYIKNGGRNIAFRMVCNGDTVTLDSTDFCTARYTGGKRSYTLRHGAWGHDAQLLVQAIALSDAEGAMFCFSMENMPSEVQLLATVCNIRNNHFMRGGDLGKDDLSQFEASGIDAHHFSYDLSSSALCLVYHEEDGSVTTASQDEWQHHEAYRTELTSRIEINTPDPLLNTLGSIMTHAADGYWDGTSWLHGCVGWRMPLAGWRGAYAGDALGWFDRSLSHFSAYANSQVTEIPPVLPHPSQDAEKGLSRAEKRWGTQMYSDGYICRNPNRNNQMHHYDMNLNYIDGLLWHLSYDADTMQLRRFWPVIKRHLKWERRNYDPDGDHLYDAYCCIWASDALYYNSGAVTHSSAYNYRANRLAARIAEILGEDPSPYRNEAEAILSAMNRELWMPERGTWCEFRDFMGLKRQHPSAALWSVYTPIDCGACSPEQAYLATRYVDREIPRVGGGLVATTDWLPYVWSTNNVAHEEVANMVLAYFKAGRKDEGYALLHNDLTDEMLMGASPGNFGQISYHDRMLKECYRDFADNIGITSRAIINGLFGITPDALFGRCIIQPALPDSWQEASIRTPYLSYSFHREGDRCVYDIEQHFPHPLNIVLRIPKGNGEFITIEGNDSILQSIVTEVVNAQSAAAYEAMVSEKVKASTPEYMHCMGLDDITPGRRRTMVDISAAYNANADDIFRNDYLSPRSPYTTLQIPVHGIGQWCHPEWMAEIEDDGLRSAVVNGIYDTNLGLSFRLPAEGHNIAYTSLWDNYPDSITVSMPGKKAQAAYLMMAGSTNNMQSRIDNGLVIAHYSDNATDTLHLMNPINWCPIEQDYITNDESFWTSPLKPLRFRFDNGYVSRSINENIPAGTFRPMGDESPSGANGAADIHHGAGVILKMPLDPRKRLKAITLRTLSNDVVIGLMAVTIE